MQRIQHPRATAGFSRGPPSNAAVEIASGAYRTASVDDEGYVHVPDRYAENVMDGFAKQYDVEYDRETGEVLGAGATDDPNGGGDEPPDECTVDHDSLEEGEACSECDYVAPLSSPDAVEDDQNAGDDGDDEDDLEAWENWNRDDWLALGWKARKSDVEDGLVDDHLVEIYDVESNQSKRVREAAKERLEELGRADELEDA